MSENKHNLDQVLARLMDGASLASLVAEYPDMRRELEAHAALLSALRGLGSEVPSESGLRAAIFSARSLPIPATPSPYLSFFMTYRTAFVLPVLVLMLIVSGSFIYPDRQRGGGTVVPTSPDALTSESATVVPTANSSAGNSPATLENPSSDQGPASLKTGDTNRMMLMTAPSDVSTTTATSTPSTSTPQAQ